MWRLARRIRAWVLSLTLVVSLVVVIVTARANLPGKEVTPAGIRQETSQYIRMRDGVEIAVTVGVPQDLRIGERLPVLMRTTRYWRAPQIGWTLRMLMALHLVSPPQQLEDKQAAYFNQRRFVVLVADAR